MKKNTTVEQTSPESTETSILGSTVFRSIMGTIAGLFLTVVLFFVKEYMHSIDKQFQSFGKVTVEFIELKAEVKYLKEQVNGLKSIRLKEAGWNFKSKKDEIKWDFQTMPKDDQFIEKTLQDELKGQ